METNSPSTAAETECSASSPPDVLNASTEDPSNTTIHPFNISNITVLEKSLAVNVDIKNLPCEGSDSGVEIIEGQENCIRRTPSSNSGTVFQELDNIRSCDSSISYCSNYDEAFNLLVRRNSTLLEDYVVRNSDRTSENGSESSSIAGSNSSRNSKRNSVVKKKIQLIENKTKPSNTKERARSKPPVTPRPSSSTTRLKSLDRTTPKTTKDNSKQCLKTSSKNVPNNLEVRRELKRSSSVRSPSNSRTPAATPTDDGRWPSINSKPAPLMSKSLRGILEMPKRTVSDNKAIEKYATLPRRKKEKAPVEPVTPKKQPSRENSVNRVSMPSKKPPTRDSYPLRIMGLGRKKKIKIYQESCIQTALTMEDVEKALSGTQIRPASPDDKEKLHKDVQVDISGIEINKLKEQVSSLNKKYEDLKENFEVQGNKLKECEDRLRAEIVEKEGLQHELNSNTQRVLTILGENSLNEEASSDSLLVLENRFQNVSQVVLNQENEISRLNALCRNLQIELDKKNSDQILLVRQHKELEIESLELQEFMQAEKNTLGDALKEAENEMKNIRLKLSEKEKLFNQKREECQHLVRFNEKTRQENMGLQARLAALEARCKDLLVQQGSSVSGAAVALSALISRLDSLTDELISCYNISEQELEDVIFHHDTYSNCNSIENTPDKNRRFINERSPSPKKGSSFVSAVINAIKNAAAQSPFAGGQKDLSGNLYTDASSSNEMLDSETEPCLMMEHVLEDVVIPDGHSHNMISSTQSLMNSRLTHSESLKDLSQAILNREKSELPHSLSLNVSYSSETSPSEFFPATLIDQVVDVDNAVTRLLKVIRIIQLESEECMYEMGDEKEMLTEQVQKQKETNAFVVKQLKDWELLGARLKNEVKELMIQLKKKDDEIESLKVELGKEREQIEKQNQDVCELSTALSKIELNAKEKEEELREAIKEWESTNKMPSADVLARIICLDKNYPEIKDKLLKSETLDDFKKELATKQILAETVKGAVAETKKQYDAIDNALEVLHSIQNVVQQCPPLAKLQKDLEEINFRSASTMPIVSPDLQNTSIRQTLGNLEIASPINSTA